MPELFIGLMSGTSLDGIDAVLADLETQPYRVVAHVHRHFSAELRAEFLALNHPRGTDELRRAALASNSLAHSCAAAVRALLAGAATAESSVHAIGCHGQTVRHQPDDGYTIQLVNGALLAELTGINVVCDFRSRDIAAGGQGAPLVPAFHHAAFANPSLHRVVVNVGGIANITNLPTSGAITGFDCGPGNLLLDAWAQRHLQQPYDNEGAWACSGNMNPHLLARMLNDGYFHRAPPKSAGREIFNLDWLLPQLSGQEKPADVQATLLAMTVHGITDAIEKFCVGSQEIYVCGGGARNSEMTCQLTRRLSPRRIAVTDEMGIAAEHVEALAFAWLAERTMVGQCGNLPSVTGARGPRILGALYRA